MTYVVTFNGAIVAGPFSTQTEAQRALEAKAREAHLGPSRFKVEHA